MISFVDKSGKDVSGLSMIVETENGHEIITMKAGMTVGALIRKLHEKFDEDFTDEFCDYYMSCRVCGNIRDDS